MYENGSADKFDKNESDTIRMLKGLPKEDPNLILDTRKFCTPKSLDELADILLDQPNARLLAGGTDLGLEITQELAQPKLIVYTGSIEAMTCIEDRDQDGNYNPDNGDHPWYDDILGRDDVECGIDRRITFPSFLFIFCFISIFVDNS